jgi:hypothetical protein
MSTTENKIIKRDYGFDGTRAIVDTAKHGRILIEDGYGGEDTMKGGCVRWSLDQSISCNLAIPLRA